MGTGPYSPKVLLLLPVPGIVGTGAHYVRAWRLGSWTLWGLRHCYGSEGVSFIPLPVEVSLAPIVTVRNRT